MSFIDRKSEKDDFWDLDKLIPKKKTATLSPFTTKPSVKDYSPNAPEVKTPNADKREEERKLTVSLAANAEYADECSFYPENTLIKSITVRKYNEKYDFYDGFRKSAALYHDCPGERCDFVQFYSYMPQYSQLNKAQKAYYFYWRSEMRQGRFIKTDYSYLYLYVYEIINLPDMIEPERGIKLLCRLWREYRSVLPRIDMYFSMWVRDYCMVHNLPCPTDEIQEFIFDVIRVSDFKEYYFTDLGKTSRGGVWSLIAYLSDYDWYRGFYASVSKDPEDTEKKKEIYKTLFEGAMRVILPSVWDECMREKSAGKLTKISYAAFPNTLCTHSVKCRLEIEYYPLADASRLREDITSTVRYTENKLRALFGAKSRISVKYIPKEYKELIDCYFDDIIRNSEARIKKKNLPEYERLYDAPREQISFEGADEIERLSWNTTMRLCDSDEYSDDAIDLENTAPIINAVSITNVAPDETDEEKQTYGLAESDIAYIRALSVHTEICIGKMEEQSLVEHINEIFSDNFGDIIIEDTGDGFDIIDDYKEEIIEWLRNL